MARPFPNTFEQDASPLSPMSAGSQAPISYSANVNRKKTKKWVEAKPADYGGDDWGDDYDDGYPPTSTPKPTGLRQAGQVAQPQPAPLQGYGDSADSTGSKKVYGELPPLPLETPARSASGPVADRMSFIPGDEQRAFSGGYAPAASSAVPAAPPSEPSLNSISGPSKKPLTSLPPSLQVSTQVPAVSGMRVTAQQDTPSDGQPRQAEPQSGASSRYSELTKNSGVGTPASDFQGRQDFSPSAVPSPLQGRYSPAPQSGATDSSTSRFPPRKSSISQPAPLKVPESSQPAQEASPYKPWTGGRSSSPGAAARSPTATGKSTPFVRPADIYKRVEEEREKERQSLDSSRPSMDSIGGGKSSDRSASPANKVMHEQSNFDSMSANSKRGPVQDNEDASDHNRRLGPMLEPVRERKSEYGFDDYGPTLATKAAEEKPQSATASGPHDSHDSAEELRRFSTSPKLPDLNRISGFGIDLFSPSKLGGIGTSEPPMTAVLENYATPNSPDPATQPSLGITSAVRQAFDAGSPSTLETPVSIGSGIERTGSESTGTTGISPIMSRVPTGVLPSTKNRESDVRETATPSITEVDESIPVQAPIDDVPQSLDSRESLSNRKDNDGSGQPNVRSGHRLDTSTPTRSGSPARTPKVADTGRYAAAEDAYLSEASDPGVSPLEDELPAPSRPSAEREQSFRPTLPGGWVSYATTNSELSSEREPKEIQRPEPPNLQIESSNTPVSPISEEGDDDYDLTPTTTKKPLRQPALSAADEAALPGNSALPTPDPALAPMGNPYASSALDPRIQDEPRQNDPGLQPPQPSVSQLPSSGSSGPPTPPPKDTPAEISSGGNPDYFPPVVPLKHKTFDEVAAKESIEPPTRPSMLPTLSTQTSPQDETNDKLRKEIIKSLSPTASDAKASNRLSPPDISQHVPYEGFTNSEARESTYLPSEYDNYWESTEGTEDVAEKATENPGRVDAESEPIKQFPTQSKQQGNTGPEAPSAGAPFVVPTPSSGGVENPVCEKPIQRPPLYANRFSWEAGPEQVTAAAAAQLQNEPQLPTPGINVSYAATPDTQLQDLEKTRDAYIEHGPVASSTITPVGEAPIVSAPQVGSNLRASSTISDHSGSADHESSGNHSRSTPTRTAAGAADVVVGAIAGATASVTEQAGQDSVSQRRPSLAEQKMPGNVSEYAVARTPPEEEHPARASLPPVSAAATTPGPVQNAQGVSQGSLPTRTPQRTSEVAKIMQFRDIVALQQPEQRIRAFNDTRYQFATMDTGLADWIMVTSSNQQEPTGPASWGGPANPGNITPRSRAAKSGSPGGLGAPLQQPYYQQYLNATPSSVPVNSRPGTGITPGSQQGFSPSGGVQGKGKESGHSTGIFGGKASKAKGLLAKGKMKLRGSGGGDKDSPPFEPSPAPKTKSADGRRTSWGLSMPSLALSRSSIRADTASQHSRAETPTHQPAPHQNPGVLAPVTADQSERSLWDAPVSAASTPSIPHSTPQPPINNEPSSSYVVGSDDRVHGGEREEERDNLGVPAPIGKYQPSWDPFNATPIAEEEGFQYDEKPRPSKPPPDATKSVPHVGTPLRPGDSKSDRSTSDDAVFHDALEKPSESEDWVLVSKDENSTPPAEPPNKNERPTDRTGLSTNGPNTPDITTGPGPLKPSHNPAQPQNPMNYQQPLKQQPPGAPQAAPPQSGRFRGPTGYQQHPVSQLGPGPQPPMTLQQAAHNQQRAVSQFPGGPQNPTVYQQQEIYQPPPGPPPGFRPQPDHQYSMQSYSSHGPQLPPGSQPHPGFWPPGSQAQPGPLHPPAAQPSAAPQGGFRGLFQHMRQKSSKDGNMPPPSQSSPPPVVNPQPQTVNAPLQVVNVAQQDLGDENRGIERQSTDFVGLPMIRRSSTFGLGFGKKDPTRRFALDDDEDDNDLDPNSTTQTTSDPEKVSREPDVDHKQPTTEAAFGAAAVAAAVVDRMYQPSVEPSRYSFDRESSLGARDTSDINAQPQGRISIPPVGPPSASTGPFRNNQPSTYNSREYTSQQMYTSPDRSGDNAPRPDARLSQESRPLSNTNLPGRPSHDAQRPAPLGSPPRGSSFEGQRMRSPSSSNPGYADTPPVLGSGVYVPPPRPTASQQKAVEQPPSSAQRYPELFRPEYAKETSVDGLPANYYQAPVSREDAFLPRTQTNEYQLPGVGPPPDEPRTGRRSRRNSALFKELGGRLSRSVSRDRGFSRDDDARSPGTPIGSHEIHGQENSAPSIASEDMSESKKRRKSGLALFGGARRDSTGGAPLTRENTGTSSPVSRVDSAPQQYQGSPLANPNTKKPFFGNGRNAVDQPKPSKLSRVSTAGIPGEQQPKKKRFSGLTSMFSRPSAEQDTRRQSESAVQAAQDPRNYQNPNANPQASRFPDPAMRQMAQDPRMFQGQPRPIANGGLQSQQSIPGFQGQFQQRPTPPPHGGPGNWQPGPAAGRQQEPQRQTSAINPEGRPFQTLAASGPPTNLQTMRPGNESQSVQKPVSTLQSPQNFQEQTFGVAQRGPINQQQMPQPSVLPVQNRQSIPTGQPGAFGGQTLPGVQGAQQPQPSVLPLQNRQSVPIGQPGAYGGQNLPVAQGTQQPQSLVSPVQSREAVSPSPHGESGAREAQNQPGAQVSQQPLSPAPNRQIVSPSPPGAHGAQNQPGAQVSQQSQPPLSPAQGRHMVSAGSPGAYGGQNLPGAQGAQQPQSSASPAQNRQIISPSPPGVRVAQNQLSPQASQQSQPPLSPAQNRQSGPTVQPGAYGGQNLPGAQGTQQPQFSGSPAHNRQGVSVGQPGAYVGQNLPGAQGPQQPQYQQQIPMNPKQVLPSSGAAPPQVPPTNSQGPRRIGDTQHPVQPNQPKSDIKPRQPSRLLSGIMGGLGGGSKSKAASQQPSGDKQQQPQQPQQQQQRQQQGQQQPQARPQMPPQVAPGQGRPFNQEPQYEQLPIPGGYTLVRGEGGYLAPTSYDPRGLNSQYGPQSNPQLMYRGQPQGYQQQPPQSQAKQRTSEHLATVQGPRVLPTVTVTAQNSVGEGRPGLDSRQSSQDTSGATRQLSSEDILARSPARPQFDQQAPYKLTLPDDAERQNAGDKPLPTDRDLALERQSPSGGKPQNGVNVPTENHMPTERTLPTVAAINTNMLPTRSTQPALRHPQSPATYPLPQDSPFSPVNPSASQVPPPPPPKWPQQAVPSQNLDRSNTINTTASEISQLSGNLSVPATSKEPESGQPASVTPPSPQLTPQRTPERSPERLRPAAAPRTVSEDDMYNATPKNSNSPTQQEQPVSDRAPQMSPEKIVVEEGMGPSQSRRRTSQEEKILVEDGMVRPQSVEEDLPSMSATSYPGMEWNPYGAAEYQDWD